MKLKTVGLLAALLFCCFTIQAFAADIYVSIDRGKDRRGEGTTASPYKTIGYAIKKAEEGDVLRIAAGDYYGEGRSGHWTVETNNLSLIGGYTDDFAARDPFANITLLCWDDSDRNRSEQWPGYLITAEKDANAKFASALSGIVIDGLHLDGGSRNPYMTDPENPSLQLDKAPSNALLSLTMEKDSVGIVRNCTFLNPGKASCVIASVRPGGSIQVYNNVLLNSVYYHMDVVCKTDKDSNRGDFDIHHNTFAFAWKRGDANGSGIRVGPYTNVSIHDNILAYGDLYAVKNQFFEKKKDERGIPKTGLVNEEVELDNNLFFMWQRGLLGWVLEGQSGNLAVYELDELEDTTLASAEDNAVGDPGLQYNTDWMKLYVSRSDAVGGEIKMDSINKLRAQLGLALLAPDGKGKQHYAMRYPLEDAVKFRQPTAEAAAGRGASIQAAGDAPVATPGAAPTKEEQIEALKAEMAKLQALLDKLLNE